MADTHVEPQPGTPQDPVAEALRRMKQRQRRGRIVKFLLLLLVAGVGAIFYLQSAHAFRHFYLPMLGRKLGTRVTAEDGAIRLTGRAWMKNVELMGNDGETAFLAEEVTARVAPLSLLPGRRPVVREARLSAAQAVIEIAKDGSTNWTFQPRPKRVAATQVKTAPKPAAAKAAPKTAEFPALEIKKLLIEKSMLEVRDSKGLDLTLNSLEASVDDFGRGRTGTFGLRAAGTLERPGIRHNFNAEGSGGLSQDAAGREIGWDGGLDARVAPDAQAGATSQDVKLRAALKGKINVSGRIEQFFDLTANTPKGPAGKLDGVVNWDPAMKERNAHFKASDVGREFLNPLLAAVGPVQLAQSRITAVCDLKGVGDAVNIDAEVTGRDLVFRIGEQKTPTPAVDLNFTQRGARLDTARNILRVETARLALQESGQPVLTSELDRPVELQLGGSSAAATAPDARINTTLRQLPVRTLQPWLILAGVAAAKDLRGGVLNGQISSMIGNAGAAIALDGQVSGNGLLLPGKMDLPLDVAQTLKGRIEKMETVSIESGAMSISSGGRKLADLDVSGRYQLTPASGAATLRLAAPEAMTAARVLGLVAGDAAKLRRDGALIAGGDVTFGKEKAVVFNGTAAFRDFVFEGRGGELPLAGKARTRLTAGAGRLAIEALNVEWTAAPGGAPGTLDVTGDWPLDGGARGQLKIAARGVDLAPWLRLTAREGAPAVTAMILDADETLQAEGKDRSLLAGELRIGRIEADGADAPMALTIKNEIARQGGQIQKLRLEAAGRLRSGAIDKVVLTGSGKWSDAARDLKLAGQIDSLNGDAWLPLFGFAAGAAPASTATRKTTTAPVPVERMVAAAVPMAVGAAPARPVAAEAGAPARRGVPMTLAVTPLTIGRVQYRGCELSKARGSLRYENGASHLVLDQGTLAGGTIVGSAEYNSARQEPAYAWEVALRQVDIPAILRVVHPKLADNFTGRGDVNSRGSGQGFGEAGKRRLQIETGFAIGNGEIRGFPFLEALAKETKVAQFRSIQFTEFTGRTSIAQGVATLKDWYEKGKDQRISVEGTVTLDGKYDLAFQPSVSKAVAGKLSQNDLARQILADQNGFMAFPFQVAVAGQGSDYHVGVRGSLNKETREQLNQGVRNLLQNVIEDKLNKQDKKNRGKDTPGEGSGVSAKDRKADSSARDEKTPAAASDRGAGGLSLEDLLNQQIQKRLEKESKKKDKKKEKKEKKDTKAGQSE